MVQDIRKDINIFSRIKEGLRKMNMYVLKKCRMLLMMFFLYIHGIFITVSYKNIYEPRSVKTSLNEEVVKI